MINLVPENEFSKMRTAELSGLFPEKRIKPNLYYVAENGCIYRKRKLGYSALTKSGGNPYPRVGVAGENNKQVMIYIHVALARAFVPYTGLNPDGTVIEGCPQVNHINCITTDNRLENLEWCDAKYNSNHKLTDLYLTDSIDIDVAAAGVDVSDLGYPVQPCRYWITSDGTLWSNKGLNVYKAMKPAITQNGVAQTMIRSIDKKNVHVTISWLVAEAFLPRTDMNIDGSPMDAESQLTVLHLDGDTTNNHVENLAWADRKFALRHMKQIKADKAVCEAERATAALDNN